MATEQKSESNIIHSLSLAYVTTHLTLIIRTPSAAPVEPWFEYRMNDSDRYTGDIAAGPGPLKVKTTDRSVDIA